MNLRNKKKEMPFSKIETQKEVQFILLITLLPNNICS